MYFAMHSTLDNTYICHVLLDKQPRWRTNNKKSHLLNIAMKNSIKTIVFALALVATAFAANAEDKETKKSAGFGTGIYTTKTGKINVMVDKVNTDTPTTLLLKNSNGEVIYREIVGKNEMRGDCRGAQHYGRIG